MYEIKFFIQNKYDKYLKKILEDINFENFMWEICDEEIFLRDGSWLFNSDKYNNENFKKLISDRDYYIIFAMIKAYSTNMDKFDLYIEIIDNIFVKINCQNKDIYDKIMHNITKYDFKLNM